MTLTNEQLKNFENKLIQEKNTIEQELAKLSNPQKSGLMSTAFPALPQEAGSPDEGIEEVEDFEAKLDIHEHLKHRLEEINTALNKMTNDKYGICENCGQEIPLERLEANPAAETCVRCKK